MIKQYSVAVPIVINQKNKTITGSFWTLLHNTVHSLDLNHGFTHLWFSQQNREDATKQEV